MLLSAYFQAHSPQQTVQKSHFDTDAQTIHRPSDYQHNRYGNYVFDKKEPQRAI